MDVPKFDDLPPVEGMPKGCAWGVFDKDGKKDVWGTLNHLTPEVVKAAAAEVKDGVSFSLDLTLKAADIVNPTRRKFEHNVFSAKVGSATYWDDEVAFNTQGSSQWDSLVHWPYQPTGQAYNGVRASVEALREGANDMPTLNRWHDRGGMVARGVLIDFKAYAEEKGIDFNPLHGYHITTDEIEAVAKHQGVEFRPGDVFLLRTGAVELAQQAAAAASEKGEEGEAGETDEMKLSGVQGNEATARWFWDHRFAAVAADNSGFESYPPVLEDGSLGGPVDIPMHKYFLSFFGMPLGEWFDLSKLGKYCKERGRYSFMLTSTTLNVPGLVGSPPNALAIF